MINFNLQPKPINEDEGGLQQAAVMPRPFLWLAHDVNALGSRRVFLASLFSPALGLVAREYFHHRPTVVTQKPVRHELFSFL
ncbi:MAG TPA: hypothetical protein PKD45_07445 [Flavobacteriales bacterium]|nr:hypothetical protein [Flavobacteriales bacterium]